MSSTIQYIRIALSTSLISLMIAKMMRDDIEMWAATRYFGYIYVMGI